jgi:opacity protein-like surface antigen
LTSSVDAKLAADTLAVGVVGKIPLNDGFELFGKVGFHAWDVELSAPGFNSLTDDGSDIYYGIGANYNLSQKLSLGVSYNSYTLDSDDSDGSVTMLSANVTYRF